MKKQKLQYNRIKAALADAGVSNKELADSLTLTEQTVSAWCTNTKQPSVQTLFLIADYLKMDVRDLLVSNKQGRLGR